MKLYITAVVCFIFLYGVQAQELTEHSSDRLSEQVSIQALNQICDQSSDRYSNQALVQFSDHFSNQTLRMDYVFSGTAVHQSIYLDELSQLPNWAGRQHHLSQIPLQGNGEINVRDFATKDCLYRTSFSSLFQEWIDTDEAVHTAKAYENSFLIPYPIRPIEVEVILRNSSQKVIARLTHIVDPADILIHKRGIANITPHKYILQNGSEKECIDVAILAEGYTQSEMDRFYEDAARTSESLFSHEPFKSMKERFNIVAVASPSSQSGVSVPRQKEWKNTAFNAHFDTFYSDRYLTTSRVKAMHDALAGIAYEHIIVLANTAEYGGGGIYNAYTLTSAHHSTFRPVVVHEFGHSFGGLADEYFYEGNDEMSNFYPRTVEPWEPNITTLIRFNDKWKDMLFMETPIPTPLADKDEYTVGVYEGAGYATQGVYRPADDCRMRTNECASFCLVCQRALRKLIVFYTEP